LLQMNAAMHVHDGAIACVGLPATAQKLRKNLSTISSIRRPSRMRSIIVKTTQAEVFGWVHRYLIRANKLAGVNQCPRIE